MGTRIRCIRCTRTLLSSIWIVGLAGSLRAQITGDTSLVGIWGSTQSYGPALHGALCLARTRSGWVATIGGVDALATTHGDSLAIAFRGDLGSFRGRTTADRSAIEGFWTQPAGTVTGTAYVTPARLVRLADSLWRGPIAPLDERFSLYLLVERRPDGSLWGSFHNPEANSRGGVGRFKIEHSATSVRFVDTTAGSKHTFTASLDSTGPSLVVPWSDLGVPIVLTRLTRDRALGLYPRQSDGTPYTYRVPSAEADGWTSASARKVGLDDARLTELVRYIIAQDPTVDTAPLIHSLLIARHGTLVLEEYFYGFDDSRLHDTRSAAKTFASVLLGAAMMHGARVGPGTPVYAALGLERSDSNPDPRKAKITVANLMTHSTGLACDDNDDDSPGNEGALQRQTKQPDWYRYMLDLPMLHDPGGHYAYCSGTMNLVGAVIGAVTHRPLPDLFQQWIATPLDVHQYAWNLMPTGQAYLGGGMYVRPRDLLKLGVTYLDGGVWNGRRIVSRDWVAASTSRQIGPPAATGTDGFAWHLNQLVANGRTYAEYEANGNGGQYLIVLPELDIAVVLTGGDYGRYGIWRRWRDDLVPRFIIGAVTDRSSAAVAHSQQQAPH